MKAANHTHLASALNMRHLKKQSKKQIKAKPKIIWAAEDGFVGLNC